MTYPMEAFVYCWTDKKTNMLYVGSHTNMSKRFGIGEFIPEGWTKGRK